MALKKYILVILLMLSLPLVPVAMADEVEGENITSQNDEIYSTSYEKVDYESYASVTSDIKAPSKPTGLVKNVVTDTTIGVSWEYNHTSEQVMHYNIYKDGSFVTSTADRNYILSDLEPGKSYQIYITSTNAAGDGEASDVILVSTLKHTPTPENVRVTNISATEMALSWDGQASQYMILVDDEVVGYTETNDYILKGLDPEKDVTVQVVAYGDMGESEPSQKITATTTTEPIPVSVTDLLINTWVYVYELYPVLWAALGIGFTFLIAESLGRFFNRKYNW